MILSDAEKQRIVVSLSWMVEDMKVRHDDTKRNNEVGSQGGYSPELNAAIALLDDVRNVKTTDETGCHRKKLSVNCREFVCESNRQGTCALSAITLASKGFPVAGHLRCNEAEGRRLTEMEKQCDTTQ
jgi:hypothetical protein